MENLDRFIARQNLKHFRLLLEEGVDPATRRFLSAKIYELQRELAYQDAEADGVFTDSSPPSGETSSCDRPETDCRSLVNFDEVTHPCLLIDPGAGLHILDVNDAFARATIVKPAEIVGNKLFDMFPDNPGHAQADGASNLFNSLRTAVVTGRADSMAVQRYDIRSPSGDFLVRYWKMVNTPVFDRDSKLQLLLHRTEDVTGEVSKAAPLGGFDGDQGSHIVQ
ncbi:PAS domain-containing protein [Henriciella aquimarina]|uniref:PAS domain-containing protein n=1 Tax=Henriciella aquimarina TaxID=545261 RepID=UPI000A07843E|nr:PAS domain-containing protein [Henriciella aquimarina]